MQLITLNIWGGHVLDPLLSFLNTHQDVDFFCFQEVYHNAAHKVSDEERFVSLTIFSQIQEVLPSHRGFFRPTVDGIYGIAIFIKKDISVLDEGEIIIHNNPDYPGIGPTHSRNLQWLKCQYKDKNYIILNVHGLWNGSGKTDSSARIIQSQNIKLFMDKVNLPQILCGDFNLRPDTQSMEIVEEGLINLVKTHKITSTRTSFYPKNEKFADYIFVSSDITVQNFKVLPDEVSDHAALFLDFD